MRCETCGEDFEPKRSDQRYCKPACRVKAHRGVTDRAVTDNPVTDNGGPPVTDKPWEAMLREADELVELQRKERGYVKSVTLAGKPCQILGPYVKTPEREARAERVIHLRREAARLAQEAGQLQA